MRANSPSAASKTDYNSKKKAAARNCWYKIQATAINPEIIKPMVTWIGVSDVFFIEFAIIVAGNLP